MSTQNISSAIGALDVQEINCAEPLTEIVSCHYGEVKGYLYKKVGCMEEATDLTQEVFFRFIRKKEASKFDSPKPFLFKIAANLLKDRARRRYTRRVDWHVSIHDIDLASTAPDQFRALESKNRLRKLERAILRLPTKCRHVFVLHRFEDMTYSQIADHFGISESMVEKHIAKALMRCRVALAEPRESNS